MKLRGFLFLHVGILFIIKDTDLAITIPKFVHQKDLSEYCRRRVIPSIFLGKQIKDANLNVMRFSRLDLPYSCMITIRTESGNSIILVIPYTIENSLLRYECKKNPHQFVVYELGETFGGYWGALPDVLIQQTLSNNTKYYTTKTTTATKSTTMPTIASNEDGSDSDPDFPLDILKYTITKHTKKEDGYIRVEVPLVNISGSIQLEDSRLPSDFDELFDDFYDVLPRKGFKYRTSVLPLLQLSVKHQKGRGRDNEPRYEIDYNVAEENGFTQDSRLAFSTVNEKVSSKKRNWYANRRLNFNKKNRLFSSKNSSLNLNKFFTTTLAPPLKASQAHLVPKLEMEFSSQKFHGINHTTESWDIIKNLMKSYKFTATSAEEPTMPLTLIDMISNVTHHNISAYLLPNLSVYDNNEYGEQENINLKNKQNFDLITKRSSQPFLMRSSELFSFETPKSKISSTLKLENSADLATERFIQSTYNISQEEEKGAVSTVLESSSESVQTPVTGNTTYAEKTEINTEKLFPNITGSMVDHESWENIVQAAPVMASVLNNTEVFPNNETLSSNVITYGIMNDSNKRDKRYIQPLDIDKSKPRDLTTVRVTTNDNDDNSEIGDMQDFANLLELQDDEIQGRLALRYLRNYIGPVLFNICDFGHTKAQRVHLLNSSRIVLAVTNFTLDKITLVITPAVTLMNNDVACPRDHCECQILGTRVCVDDINACDGVPNCGTNDIYDEDRFLCGANADVQYIFLTALTFIAVILTAFYTVHYWLRRCVPKVSEAFFVYTDTSENTLYLDSIMRSPTDGDISSSKFQYPDHYFEDGFCDDIINTKETSTLRKILRTCFTFLLCKRKQEFKKDSENELPPINPKRMYSFTKLELSKMTTSTKEEITQTGDSLLINISNKKIKQSPGYDKKELQIEHSSDGAFVKTNEIGGKYKKQEHIKELDLIKLTKKSSLQSFDTISSDKARNKLIRRLTRTNYDEKELKSTIYERQNNLSSQLKENKLMHESTENVEPLDKHLRFEEEPIMIPTVESFVEEGMASVRCKKGYTLEVPSFSGRHLTSKESFKNSNKDTSKGKKSKNTAKMFKR